MYSIINVTNLVEIFLALGLIIESSNWNRYPLSILGFCMIHLPGYQVDVIGQL